MNKRAFFLFITFLLTAGFADAGGIETVPYKKLTRKYDMHFNKYTKRFFGPGFEWKWFKAQAFAESGLNDRAESWVKAKGIMQLMPRTFEEIRKKNPSFIDVYEPRWNIAAGIYYNQRLYGKWKAERPFADRVNFMLASYNAGFATIVRAQKICKNKGLDENLWKNIKTVAPDVPRWRHRETVGYVRKINALMDEWADGR